MPNTLPTYNIASITREGMESKQIDTLGEEDNFLVQVDPDTGGWFACYIGDNLLDEDLLLIDAVEVNGERRMYRVWVNTTEGHYGKLFQRLDEAATWCVEFSKHPQLQTLVLSDTDFKQQVNELLDLGFSVDEDNPTLDFTDEDVDRMLKQSMFLS